MKKKKTPKGCDGDSLDDISISSMECGMDSSSSTSSSSSSSSDDDEDGGLSVKAGALLKVRPEFPKTNIRRWMTPGSRYDTPQNLPTMEDIIQDKRHFKQTKIGWVKPSLAQLKETKGKGEDPGAAGKEGKDAKNDELPIPKHRRRTKSWRYLIYVIWVRGCLGCCQLKKKSFS